MATSRKPTAASVKGKIPVAKTNATSTQRNPMKVPSGVVSNPSLTQMPKQPPKAGGGSPSKTKVVPQTSTAKVVAQPGTTKDPLIPNRHQGLRSTPRPADAVPHH